MKRKSGRRVSKKLEDSPNGIEENNEQNGDATDHEDDGPKDKKKRSRGGSRKSVSFSSKKEDQSSAESERSEDEQKEEKKPVKGRRSYKKDKEKEDPLANSEFHEEEADNEVKKTPKKGKKAAQKEIQQDDVNDQDEDEESQYEVESILDDKILRGQKHYLIRWKGYEEESDTWEPEGTLNCPDLIKAYKEQKKKNKGKKLNKKESKVPDWDENEDFEVDRILEVHHKRDGSREFLVSWKGYSAAENSWEPEENMDCKELIQRFMEKVERAKEIDERELRVKRKQVQRFTLSTQETARRLSKRFRGRERVQYHDAE